MSRGSNSFPAYQQVLVSAVPRFLRGPRLDVCAKDVHGVLGREAPWIGSALKSPGEDTRKPRSAASDFL